MSSYPTKELLVKRLFIEIGYGPSIDADDLSGRQTLALEENCCAAKKIKKGRYFYASPVMQDKSI
jgi:hypothetical protein